MFIQWSDLFPNTICDVRIILHFCKEQEDNSTCLLVIFNNISLQVCNEVKHIYVIVKQVKISTHLSLQ